MTSDRSRGWSALVPFVVIAALVGILVLTTGSGATPSNPKPTTTVDDVGGDPARYEGQQRTLSGTVAQLRGHENAFVLIGAGGGRLLVEPPAGSPEPPADGAVVQVRAFVRLPESGSERAKLTGRAGASALLDAVRVVETG